MNAGKEKSKKRLDMIEKQTLKQELECTFVPETNTTDFVFQNSKLANTDFITRQNMLIERRYLSTKKVEKEIVEKECTFQPNINPLSAYIAEETRINCLEKAPEYQLYYLPIKKKAVLQAELSKQEEQKYTFKPSINSVSKMIAKSKTVNELADYMDKEEKIKKMKNSMVSKELTECSFKPNINTKSRNIKSRYKSVKTEDEVKKAVIERQKEFEEIKDCTFKPIINQYVRPESVEVKGMNGFLKKNELARKLKEEQKLREMKIFRPEVVLNNFGSTKNNN